MVGKNISEKLSQKYHNILTPQRKELDCMDINQVEQYIKKHNPDFIIHCAGKVGGIQANTNFPVEFLYENIQMGFNIIMSAKKIGVKNLINIGSSCMYPENIKTNLRESMLYAGKLESNNEGYAIAKCTCARLCELISQQYHLYKYKTIIPCNLYGKYDKFDPNYSHLIPAVIYRIDHAIKNNLNKITIWGDGNNRREFLYAGDLADLVFLAVNNFDKLPFIMNVGLGFDYSINEYYSIISKILGFSGIFIHDLRKPAGMPQRTLNIENQINFGFKASTTLEEGIIKTYEYYKSIQTCQ